MANEKIRDRSISFEAAEVGQKLCQALIRDRQISQKSQQNEKELLDQKTQDLAKLIKKQQWLPFLCTIVSAGSAVLAALPLANATEQIVFDAIAKRGAPDFKEAGNFRFESRKTLDNADLEKLRSEKEEHTQTAQKADQLFSRVVDDLSVALRHLRAATTS